MYLPTILSDFVENFKNILFKIFINSVQKHFTSSIFIDKKGYDLSQYDVEVCT